MKKKFIAFFVLIFIMLLLDILLRNVYFDSGIDLIVNWGVFLPNPTKIEVVYQFDFREGETFEMWSYSDKAFDKIVSKKSFKKITKNNIDEVKDKMDKYQKCLHLENDKKGFNDNVVIDDLLRDNNYYLYKERSKDPQTFILILADSKTKMLYYFEEVW